MYIQTLCPEHYAIVLARTHDFPGFFAQEAQLRESLHYPPFARLAAITGLGPSQEALHAAMQRVEATLRAWAGPARLQVLGPAPSPIPRLRGRYREQILVKGELGEARKRELQAVLVDIARAAQGVEFQVDVDPANML